MRLGGREVPLGWAALAAVVVAIASLTLALTALGTPGSQFAAALVGVGTATLAVVAVVAELRARGHDERVTPKPVTRGSAPPELAESRRDGRGRNDKDERRRALRGELTSVARELCKVPVPSEYLCGRDKLVASVVERMRAARDAGRPAVALLVGQPGVGTSTVAWAAAGELKADFPDGVFRVDLRGLIPGMRLDAAAVVELVARAVNLHLDAELGKDEERLRLLTNRLDGRRVLLILDHAKDAEHVAPLVSPPIAAGIIVTSRNRSQNYVSRGLFFDVRRLRRGAAIEMLGMFAQDRPHTHSQLARLARLCAHVPLALNAAGRQIQSGVPGNLDTLIGSLEKEKLANAVRTAIRLSYDNLEDPAAQRTFRLLSAAAGYACTPAEMAYITGEPGPHGQRLLTLVERSLAMEPIPYASAGDLATYSLYELVSHFAREELAKEEPETAILHLERNSVTFLRDRLRAITTGAGLAAAADRLDPARYQAAELMAEDRGWPRLAADLADGLHVLLLDRGAEDTAAAIHDRLVRLFLDGGSYAAASAAWLTAAQRLDDRGATRSAVQAATRAAEIAREHGLETDLARADAKLHDLLGKLNGSEEPEPRMNGGTSVSHG